MLSGAQGLLFRAIRVLPGSLIEFRVLGSEVLNFAYAAGIIGRGSDVPFETVIHCPKLCINPKCKTSTCPFAHVSNLENPSRHG